MTTYPIKIAVSTTLANELAMCEEGRHEDYLSHKKEYPNDLDVEPCHAYHIANQAIKTSELICNNPEEATDLYYAVCSGTFQLYHLTTARRIANLLRNAVNEHDPKLVAMWTTPHGY